MRLTFFNGVDTVGGVQILLSAAGGSVQFDLGVVRNPAIAPEAVLFNDFVRPRSSDALRDYLRAGMAPRVEGLYRPAPAATDEVKDPARLFPPSAADVPLIAAEDRGELAVFVSHAHDDHMELLPYVAPDVAVHVAQATGTYLDALVAAGEVDTPGAPVQALREGESFRAGGIVCEPVAIDHDIPGCAGFIAHTPGGTLAYTGDWRYHGGAPKLVDRFVERCRATEVDVLLTEGSTLVSGPPRPQCTEQELVERFETHLAGATGLVTVGLAARNVERVLAFARVARAHGRRLVLRPGTARILREAQRSGLVATLDDRSVAVLVSDEDGDVLDPAWEVVRPEEVARDRREFVCELAPEAWYLWLDLGAGQGDLHVHANGPPYGPGDPAWCALETWVRHLGMALEVLDSHGHASPADLEWMAREIGPRVVIPVHSNEPALFPAGEYELVLPGRGESIELSVGA